MASQKNSLQDLQMRFQVLQLLSWQAKKNSLQDLQALAFGSTRSYSRLENWQEWAQMPYLRLLLGNGQSARSFLDRSFFMDVRAGCLFQYACFSRIWRAWPKFLAGCPQGYPARNFLFGLNFPSWFTVFKEWGVQWRSKEGAGIGWSPQ